MTAKILLFDIETAPLLSYTWGTYNTNVIKVVRDWYMLTWAAKWYGEKKVMAKALPDYASYKKDPECDKALAIDLYALLDEADIVVAHNGDKFDIKKVNARFIKHGLKPPSPFKTVDTLKVARGHAGFTSNRLDDLGEHLGLGRKIKTDFSLWEGCMYNDKTSWNKMVKYNKQDVVLLERVYDVLKPWTPRHPNMTVFSSQVVRECAHCGSASLQSRGYYHTNTASYHRFSCNDCGGWTRARKSKDDGITTIVCDRK